MDKSEAEIRRGKQAAILLSDPLLKQAIESLRADFYKAWEHATHTDEREECWHQLQVLAKVERKLISWVANGNVAAQNINQ